ncbi:MULTISPECIES: NUDIX domain-containing protein [unclassified Kaistella]|uniref:NUDIX hydrolase n=1 Tax=unclassified Kaistella TaxID=2762626 RepID=UPI00273603FE|nr:MULTISPECIES: NUDIX domain-containing protein [unclassified Kaistella]MDP2452743.1 NUDIX domain-containing protein [Kaistella sp. SH11-4b]MDP2455652.1 NUDIX domain-containing protein [Kaistella sp. SH40-3]MDP2458556.1 NUDIX domain-containing protein [Kaistella sp. SH19-2b]
MNDLKYCPTCGNASLNWDGEKRWSCSNCDYVLFHNVAGAVAVIIKNGDEILFTRRNQEPKKGKLDLAGGFVDPKESAENTCVRELFEEMKIKVDISQLKYLASLPNTYEYKNILYNTIDLFYEYEVSEKLELHLELSEISETIWIKKNEIIIEDIAFDSQKIFFKNYIDS